MGNAQSSDGSGDHAASSSSGTSAAALRALSDHRGESATSNHKAAAKHHGEKGSNPSAAKASSAPPPTAQIIHATSATPSTYTSTEHAHATSATITPQRQRSRPRSATVGTSATPPPEQAAIQRLSPASAMGNEESKQSISVGPRPESRSAAGDVAGLSKSKSSPDSKKDTPSPAAQPVDVPQQVSSSDGPSDLPTPSFSESSYGPPPTNYSRPPRLPLPIEEETYSPGSPIITPQDVNESLVHDEVEGGALVSRGSVLSSNADDDEDGDNDAFLAEASQGQETTRVPKKLEWLGSGQLVFVTGTFCNWEKKIKLHRNKDSRGFSAVLPLRPGTHHLKFLVDGEMTTNTDMPTTVDWGNNLVNYFEVAAPAQPNEPAAPIAIPGAIPAAGKTSDTARAASAADQKSPTAAVLPVREKDDAAAERAAQVRRQEQEHRARQLNARTIPRKRYTTHIPEFLLDLDRYNTPEDERFRRASQVFRTLPQPPSLPSFLGKSILNMSTPQKDDASVLQNPNHTTINHLMTSSIKGGVLAVSGTTRYKKKFLTTIMYKPSSSDG